MIRKTTLLMLNKPLPCLLHILKSEKSYLLRYTSDISWLTEKTNSLIYQFHSNFIHFFCNLMIMFLLVSFALRFKSCKRRNNKLISLFNNDLDNRLHLLTHRSKMPAAAQLLLETFLPHRLKIIIFAFLCHTLCFNWSENQFHLKEEETG